MSRICAFALVADRVDLDLEGRGVGAAIALHALDLGHRDAAVAGVVVERREHQGGPGAERAVHERLHAADPSRSRRW
jgi:hypothetical protein